VPSGLSITVDGNLDLEEWSQALTFPMTSGGEVLMQHSDGYLFLGIRSDNQHIGVGSLCVVEDDQISILHSSAALGTEIYQKDDDRWQLIQPFEWCCRQFKPSEERSAFLETDGWMASIGYMGRMGETEYQIALQSGQIRMVVNYLIDSTPTTNEHWPATIHDQCTTLPLPHEGSYPLQSFSPDSWPTIVLLEESD
jgi:hypothetical protein